MERSKISELIEKDFGRLIGFSIFLTRDQEIARDLLHDAFVKMIENADRFDGENFQGWSNTIVRNVFVNEYRRSKLGYDGNVQIEECLAFDQGAMVEQIDLRLFVEDVMRVVDSDLSPNLRRALMLYAEGYRYQEIAKAAEISLEAVKSRIFSARKIVREVIGELYAFGLD